MNKINYDLVMEEKIKSFEERKRLLLHSCCAPCSTACLERLINHFDVTVFYYNPNIDTKEEFTKRANEQRKYCEKIGVGFVLGAYDKEVFLSSSTGLESEKEGGLRCEKCFDLRLKKTATYAKENGFDLFASTLTVSPLKNSDLINQVGFNVEKEIGVEYLPSDFKKKDGYKRSIILSNENQMYRQNYCGCEFSKRD